MEALGALLRQGRALTRDEMCGRLGCPRKTFDKWMLPQHSLNSREMPNIVWNHVREVIEHESLKRKVATARSQVQARMSEG